MAKYKKIPVTIEAYTFDEMKDLEEKYGAVTCNESMLSSFEINGRKIEQINTDTYRIQTLEGYHNMTRDDMLIIGVKGEAYPCKIDIFEMTYVKDLALQSQKSLHNTCSNGATKNVKDIVFWGNGDTFQLISKASSEAEGWMKSIKAMKCGKDVVIQVTTQQKNPDGSYSVAEALTTAHNKKIVETTDKNGNVVSRTIEEI
jgi:hypothetical protein